MVSQRNTCSCPNPTIWVLRGSQIPAKSDISAYFFYHSLNLLRTGGKLGFIVSDGWMSADYGHGLKRFMLDHSHVDLMIKPDSNVFNDADVKNVIMILGGSGKTRLASIHTHDELGKEIQYTEAELGDENWNHHFIDSKLKPKIKMVKANQVNTIIRGKGTGHAKFFVLDQNRAALCGISKKFLVPCVSTKIRPGLLSASNAKEYLLNVNETKGSLARSGEDAMLCYIEEGEKKVVTTKRGANRMPRTLPNLISIRSRKLWYSLGLKDVPSILISRNVHNRVKVYENDGNFHAKDNFFYITPHQKSTTHALLAFLSSSWCALYQERNGHAQGAGALCMDVGGYENLPVPDFDAMPPDDLKRMKSAWIDYCENFDQDKLDGVVCDILGFGADEQKEISASLKNAIRRRTKKE